MDLLKKVSRRYSGKIQEKGFALPTVLILSIVLLAIGVSTLQVGAAISRSLVDQHWNRLAKSAGQSAIEVFSSCYDKGGTSSTDTLVPNTTCSGVAVTPARDIYLSSDTSALASPSRWRSTYTIAPPTTGSDGIARVKVVGKVEVLTSDSIVVKTYSWNYTILVNYDFTKAIKFDSQGSHTCALTAERIVYCNGKNTSGESGSGTFTSPVVLPTKFQLPTDNAIDLVMGGNITCVLTADQLVYCAGSNVYGQLGNNSLTDSATPVQFQLPAGKLASSMSVNDQEVCVLTIDQLIYCAGLNDTGQLGNNSLVNSAVPVLFQMPVGKTPILIRLGGFNACTLTSDKELYCAGKNNLGQHSDGTINNHPIPSKFQLPAGLRVASFSVGYNNVCAITTTQLLYCAGSNNNGQLSDGTTTQRTLAVKFNVPSSKTVADVRTGNVGTCILTTDQLIYCIGKNDTGQFGNGTLTDSTTPVLYPVPGGAKVAKLANSRYITCAITVDRLMYCSGENYAGQLSDGTTIQRTSPVLYQLPVGKKINSFVSSSNVVCVTTIDQYGYCAGDNSNAQLGDGTTINRSPAVRYRNP